MDGRKRSVQFVIVIVALLTGATSLAGQAYAAVTGNSTYGLANGTRPNVDATWGVDSAATIGSQLSSTESTYGVPTFWGRYVAGNSCNGSGLSKTEAASALAGGISILAIDDTATCDGASSTNSQGVAAANTAVTAAHALGIPAGVAIFEDIEEGNPVTTGFIEGFYNQVVATSSYLPGFYGNSVNGDFNDAYCGAVAANSKYGNSYFWASEPEKPPYRTGPASMPAFTPDTPSCAANVVAWQYGEVNEGGPNPPNVDTDEYVTSMAGLWRGSSEGYETAYQASDGDLSVYSSIKGNTTLSLGMKPDTSPSITALTSGGFEVAFQANTGDLYLYSSTSGATELGLAMMAGTSPSITALPGGDFEVAFQANTGNLSLYSSATGSEPLGLGMMAGTSPSITTLSTGTYEVAFQANTGDLYLHRPGDNTPLGLGMMAETSPSITALSGGSYEVAFQANTGDLYLHAPGQNTVLGLGMKAGTSPSITTLSSGKYEVAFQANTGDLYLHAVGQNTVLGLGMMAGTSPSLTAYSGSYEVAFQANTGDLYLHAPGQNTILSLAMGAGTNPAIAA